MTEENNQPRQPDIKERIVSLIGMGLIFITIWYMLNIVLLTFIITFVFYHLIEIIQRRRKKMLSVPVPDSFILTVLYIAFIIIMTVASVEIVPKLAEQFTELANIFMNFDINSVRDALDPRLAEAIQHIDFNKYIAEAGVMLASGVTKVGGFGVNLFLSLVLSFLLLLEKNKIKKFGEMLADSRISFMYSYWMTFGGNFVKTFGKVMKVQVTIAMINSLVSMIILTVLGFPQIMGLGVMIFFLGLIPVAGMVISLVPLTIIAFNIGGFSKVLAVVLMIIIIHGLEAYVLNPKLMSDQTELPVCFVFIILLVSEHYLKVWGLLIGVPIFIFLMNALEVDYGSISTKKREKD